MSSAPERDDADPRPWEQSGQWRNDGLPHRGRQLGRLAVAAVWLALLGWLACLPSPVGLALGALAWWMARRDRRLMAAKVMDPAGRELTEQAEAGGLVAVCLSIIPTLIL